MMRQYRGIFVMVILILLVPIACGTNKDKAYKDKQEAAEAAKTYYEQLAKGKYTEFIKGENRSQHLPKSYLKQLMINLQKFTEEQTKDLSRIDSITVDSSSFSAKDSTAYVYLLLHRADKRKLQTIIPMIKKNGKWLMR